MTKGIEVRFGPGDRERLEAVIGSGNSHSLVMVRVALLKLTFIVVDARL